MAGCIKSAARFCLLLVLVLWATQGLCANKKPPLHPVNVNTATSEQLQEAIKGIGPKRLEKMRKYLTVGNPSTPQKPSTRTAAKPATKPAPAPKASPPAESDDEEQ